MVVARSLFTRQKSGQDCCEFPLWTDLKKSEVFFKIIFIYLFLYKIEEENIGLSLIHCDSPLHGAAV